WQRRARRSALLGLALIAVVDRASAADGPDSLRVRVELGANTDYTNELFYEDTFDSTAFTGRHLVDSPETRYAGVLFTRLTGGRGDLLTASGSGAEYILDRTAGTVLAALERAPLWGLQWRIDYAFTGRVFADSTDRNHYEHTVDGQMRFDGPGGRPLLIEAGADRRTTMEQ